MVVRVLLLSRYPRIGASSRYRFYQFLPYLQGEGFEVTCAPLVDRDYLRRRFAGQNTRRVEVVNACVKRALQLAKRKNFDLIWIEKEAFPYLPWWVERLLVGQNVPYVVDYDDATFHTYDQHGRSLVRCLLGKKIDCVMRESRFVVAGNAHLAQRALDAGAENVTVLPTVVDLDRYRQCSQKVDSKVVIGWIGTPFTAKYLEILEPILPMIDNSRFVAIGSGPLDWSYEALETFFWTEDTEVARLSGLDIGVMPLVDNAWERGKCGLKLIQYMALGIPVVASPVGVNADIVEPGVNGFLCETPEEWREALQRLADDPVLRERLGRAGRRKVETSYSLQAVAPVLVNILRDAVRFERL